MHRVQKLLSNYGYCSRRKAEEIIKAGRVKVNDKVITIGDKASEKDKIYVDNKLVKKEKKVYIIFNKPIGCVTAVKDEYYKTVLDYVKIEERIFPIGRLDFNTSGLLILTNDGDFANRVMHPRYEVEKTYLVELHKPIINRQIKTIESGIKLDDGETAPAKIKKHTPLLLEITIHEGKNRIIRRIFQKLDFKVISLERVRIGKLELSNLKPGEYRELTKKELDLIK
ncbi:MAG: pseudouridine synthase [Nanoarchaeota archaeon]|nr:pseudouridine synthase [Nanoarchaeota archaeon]